MHPLQWMAFFVNPLYFLALTRHSGHERQEKEGLGWNRPLWSVLGSPTHFWKLPPSAAGGDGQGEGEPGPPTRGRKRTKSPNRKCSQGVLNTRTLASHWIFRNCQKMRLKYEIADLHFYCPQNLHNYPTNQSFVMTTGPILNPESHYRVPLPLVNCPTRQSLLLFIGSLHRFPYPNNKEI